MATNDKCIRYIKAISNLGHCIAEEFNPAFWGGIDGHEFTENDLKCLQAKYDELFEVYNNLPNIENAVHFNRPVGCLFEEHKPGQYPCSECEANAGSCCLDKKKVDEHLKRFLKK